MSKKNDDTELVNKVIDLVLLQSIKESNIYLKMLDNQIKIYENHLDYLETNKPLFFQKKKLQKHNEEIEEYEKKIYNLRLKMDNEVDEILKIQQSIQS